MAAFFESTNRTQLGQPVTIGVEVAGGLGPYAYNWSGLPPGCRSLVWVVGCSPRSSGNYLISVNITDANGVTVRSNPLGIAVEPIPEGPPPAPEPLAITDGVVLIVGMLVAMGIIVVARLNRERSRRRRGRRPDRRGPIADG